MTRRPEDRERIWICGKCGHEWPILMDSEDPSVCPECGYSHGQRDNQDVPEEVKLGIHR